MHSNANVAEKTSVPSSEFAQGWRVVLAALLGVACGASPVPYNAIGQLLGPVHAQMGWSLRDISLAITLYGVIAACTAPLFGWLADRYGVRRVALASLVTFGLSFGSLAFIPGNLWAWWIGWSLAGLLGMGSTPITWTRGINLWFFRQRGMALGMTLIGTSLTAMVVPLLAGWGIDQFGWRAAFPVLAALPLVIALPVAWIWFREPRPEQRPPQVSAGGRLTGVSTSQALHDYRFWLIFISVTLIALAYGGIFVHLQQMFELKGFEKTTARGVVSTLGLAILFGRLGTGWLLDRVWAPWVTLPLLSAPAIACLLLAGPALSLPLAYVSALIVGLAAGAETDLIAYLAGRYFGMANYGRIYGLLYMPFGIASAVSPAAYGWVRDSTGNYDLALHVALVMFLVGALMLLLLGRYPDFSAASLSAPQRD